MKKKVNRVGLGTYPFAGGFSPISKENAQKIVMSFLDKGGYYIDTAPVYGFGAVELLLGEVLQNYPRETYSIATKCGYVDVEGKNFQTVQKSATFHDVVAECEKSLKRLRTDYIDIYFVHWPDPNTPPDETMDALTKLQQDGKIRQIGVSNVTPEQLQKYNTSGHVKFIQNKFSLLNRSISPELKTYMKDHAIQLVPYQVIDRGLLTDKIFQAPETILSGWVKRSLSPIAKRLELTIGQLAIAWALHQEYVGFVIVGLTNPGYVEINLNANTVGLDKNVLLEIDAAYDQLESAVLTTYGQSVMEFRQLH